MGMLAATWAMVCAGPTARAHVTSLSYVIVEVEGPQVHAYLELDCLDVRESLQVDSDKDGLLSAAEVAAASRDIAGLVARGIEISTPRARCTRGEPRMELAERTQRLHVRWDVSCPDAVRILKLRVPLPGMIPMSTHVTHVRVRGPGGSSRHLAFDRAHQVAEVEVDQPPELTGLVAAFSRNLAWAIEGMAGSWRAWLLVVALALLAASRGSRTLLVAGGCSLALGAASPWHPDLPEVTWAFATLPLLASASVGGRLGWVPAILSPLAFGFAWGVHDRPITIPWNLIPSVLGRSLAAGLFWLSATALLVVLWRSISRALPADVWPRRISWALLGATIAAMVLT